MEVLELILGGRIIYSNDIVRPLGSDEVEGQIECNNLRSSRALYYLLWYVMDCIARLSAWNKPSNAKKSREEMVGVK